MVSRACAATHKKLVDNRCTENTLSQLTADHLRAIEITVLGDVLSILGHAKTVLSSPSPQPPADSTVSTAPPFKPPTAAVKLPSITPNMTHPQFRKFAIDWTVYKKITRLPESEIASHLYSACDESVQNTLINSFPTFFELPEDEMLATIESVVTKRVNPAVHRMNFGALTQHESESIQDFLVWIRTLATDCAFSCPNCEADISKVHIKDQFIRGLHNIPLQTDILAKSSTLKTIDDVVKHAEAFETALRDQSQLQHSAEANAVRLSSYRRQQQKNSQNLQHAMGVEAVNMASRVYLHVTPIVPHGAKRVPSASGLTICQQCADNLAPLED